MLTDAGVLNAHQELGLKRKDIERLAHVAYHPKDIGAAIASGSFLTEGMVIAPCSMKTLAAVAHAHADDLVSRAADVVLKERRRLVLLPREAPLNLAHLRNMVQVTEMGGIVFPPVPAFYAKPKTIDDLVAHMVGNPEAFQSSPLAFFERTFSSISSAMTSFFWTSLACCWASCLWSSAI